MCEVRRAASRRENGLRLGAQTFGREAFATRPRRYGTKACGEKAVGKAERKKLL